MGRLHGLHPSTIHLERLVIRRTSRRLRFPLGLLALWLSLWPAGDAVSGSSLTMVMPESTAPSCCADQAPAGSGCPAASRSGCDAMAKPCVCLLLGGLAFHGTERITVDPGAATGHLPAPAPVFAPTHEPEPPQHPPTVPA